jgi:diacylglycerol kinase family enzyme
VLVANGGAASTPVFKLHPHITVDDGWLDVLIFTVTTPAQVAATLGQLGGQRLDRSPHVLWRRTRRARIDADPPLAVELDGDIHGLTPREFSIRPASLSVIVPRND